MANQKGVREFHVIDTDPHFRRVVGNFRQSDYLAWAAGTAALPGGLYWLEKVRPSPQLKAGMGPTLRLATFLGACGGFLFAYQRSTWRFWGWTENSIEKARAEEEGLSAPGLDTSKSSLDPYIQGVAHRNSVNSQLKFSVFPVFNLVNHPYHGPNAPTSEDAKAV